MNQGNLFSFFPGILLLFPPVFDKVEGQGEWTMVESRARDKCPGQSEKQLDLVGKPCNFSLYKETDYAKSWGSAHEGQFTVGGSLFESWFKERCKKIDDIKWRGAVCDGWPGSLLECRPEKKAKATSTSAPPTAASSTTTSTSTTSPKSPVTSVTSTSPTIYTCDCLSTKLTKLVKEKKKESQLTVCQVAPGSRCSASWRSLHCQGEHKCKSGYCSGAFSPPFCPTLLSTLIIFIFVAQLDAF